jgi:hypothetical protein
MESVSLHCKVIGVNAVFRPFFDTLHDPLHRPKYRARRVMRGRPADYDKDVVPSVRDYIKKRRAERRVPSIEGLAVFLDKTAHIQRAYHKMLLTRQGYKDASDITSCDKPLNTISDSDRAAIDKAHDILKQSGAQ